MTTAAGTEQNIGVILVHGIGDHKRFQHLEGSIRPLIDAIARRELALDATRPNGESHNVTVEIIGGGVAALHAEQDSWSTDSAPVRVVVKEQGVTKHIHVHEVWWADVNEPYTLWKQIGFWGWGLSVWNVARHQDFDLPGAKATMALPEFPSGKKPWIWWLRFRLFCVCNIFAMAGFSLGAAVFFAKRLFSFQAPDIVKIFVNYIGAVRLYSQKRRSDGGFLDAYHEPPRVSIRRRMVRTIADAALANYDRWYVVAHSLGSVVAFNGLMENEHAILNYLSEDQLHQLAAGVPDPAASGQWILPPMAGKPRGNNADGTAIDHVGDVNRMLPARPVWLERDTVAYRDRLLAKFHGLLTYGSPLDKFAAIWPPRVPINKREKGLAIGPEPDRKKREWINVYDPTDPVSAKLDAFGGPSGTQNVVLAPTNYSYAAHWLLLYSHLRYFDSKTTLSDKVAEWILTGASFRIENPSELPWLMRHSVLRVLRTCLALLTWALVYLALTALGALTWPLWKSLFVDGGGTVAKAIGDVWKKSFPPGSASSQSWLIGLIEECGASVWKFVTYVVDLWLSFAGWIDGTIHGWFATFVGVEFVNNMLRLSLYVALITFAAGWVLRYRTRQDPPAAASGSVTTSTAQSFRPSASDNSAGGGVVAPIT